MTAHFPLLSTLRVKTIHPIYRGQITVAQGSVEVVPLERRRRGRTTREPAFTSRCGCKGHSLQRPEGLRG